MKDDLKDDNSDDVNSTEIRISFRLSDMFLRMAPSVPLARYALFGARLTKVSVASLYVQRHLQRRFAVCRYACLAYTYKSRAPHYIGSPTLSACFCLMLITCVQTGY